MTIPASRLLDFLIPGESLLLRNSDFTCANSSLDYVEAIRMTVAGEVEGIASPSGNLRYLRFLNEDEREPEPEKTSLGEPKGSSAFAQTNMGVVREPVREVTVVEEFGIRRAIASGEISGYMYSLRNQPATIRHAQ